MSLVLLGLAACGETGNTSSYPERAIEVWVPFPAGGFTDSTARLVTQYLSEEMGQQITVVNKEGAGGVTATTEFLSAEADGYVVEAMVSGPITLARAVQDLEYTWESFQPLGSITTSPYALVVPATSEFDTARALVDAVAADPASFNWATGSPVGPATFATAQLLSSEGIDANAPAKVTFDGDGPAANAVAGGHVDFGTVNATTAIPLAESGQLRILSVTGGDVLASLPDVPSAPDADIPGYTITNWFGFIAPDGVPEDVVTAWSTALDNLADNEEFVQAMEDLGAEVRYRSPDDFSTLLDDEYAAAGELAAELDLSQ